MRNQCTECIASDYYNHAAGLPNDNLSTFKNKNSMSTTGRQISNKLRTLSIVLTLISDSIKIKSRADKSLQKSTNDSYVKSRLHTISGNKDITSEMHLQSFIDHTSSKKLKYLTPKPESTRKRKSTKITPDNEQFFLLARAPTPPNNQKFLVEEALTLFDMYNMQSKLNKGKERNG